MLRIVGLSVIVVLAAGSANISAPNLLFMMTDQQRWDTIGLVTPSFSTPNLDRIAKEGALFKWGFTSTPTCTPARAAILTGQKPWNHGSLGAIAVANSYPFEMPSVLADLGYSTTSIGKDHFGWVKGGDGDGGGDGDIVNLDGYTETTSGIGTTCLDDEDGEDNKDEGEDFPPPWGPSAGHGVLHGYQQASLYDGIVSEPDDYHQWFARQMDGKKPETGWPKLDMNSWRGEAYAYANESLHPTAWVGQQAVDFITDRSSFITNSSLQDVPWFLKVSFHRPHSPYDPPQRLIDKQPVSSLRPVHYCAKDDPLAWDSVFADIQHGCNPAKLDAWCGNMPANESVFARRCYQANIAFIDEWVGKIFDALTATSQLESTYILYTADHGDGQSGKTLNRLCPTCAVPPELFHLICPTCSVLSALSTCSVHLLSSLSLFACPLHRPLSLAQGISFRILLPRALHAALA
jgi:arylsulfatase A-like enzyme